jgi:hypothetical protein
VYSGHGNYDQEGRGYVHLKDGRFTTRDLYYEVFGPTSGPNPHHVVLIVDACNAALLVNSRGGGSDRRRVRGTSLKLEDYPNVGVILSSSTVAEVHEWGRYLSGIFSHEVRSGLLGPADLNDNREIDFVELAAFVAAANAEVRNETYRVRPYIRPPLSAPNMPLVSLDNARFTRRIRLGAGLSGRAHLMNAELLRYADFHKGAQQNFWLGVPGQGEFVLVHQGQEYLIPADASGELELGDLQRRENTAVAARGTDQYFEERLFAQAHSASQAQDWLQARYLESLVVERFETLPWYHNAGAWSLFGTGLATLGGAVGMHVAARGAADDAHAAPWYAERTDAIDRAGRYQNTAIALYAVGGAAALSSVLWFALEEPVEARRYEPPFRIQVGPGGVQLSAEF